MRRLRTLPILATFVVALSSPLFAAEDPQAQYQDPKPATDSLSQPAQEDPPMASTPETSTTTTTTTKTQEAPLTQTPPVKTPRTTTSTSPLPLP